MSQVPTSTSFIRPLILTKHAQIQLLLLWPEPFFCTPASVYQIRQFRQTRALLMTYGAHHAGNNQRMAFSLGRPKES